MNTFFLSLGGNMGDRFAYLKEAIRRLREHPQLIIGQISSIFETEPVGYTEQPAFLNLVVGGNTSLSAHQLLLTLNAVEENLGRKRDIRWGPRTIDIDILLYGSELVMEENLQIPHPRMLERLFVLIPLAEIAPKELIPIGEGQFSTPEKQLEKVKNKSGVTKWKHIDWETEFEPFEN
jgi:2-amino-4-hydroxy-6-hydroxymethyldihydropteridine diphosphokinase